MEADGEMRRILGFDLVQAANREHATKPEQRVYAPLTMAELRKIAQVLENIGKKS